VGTPGRASAGRVVTYDPGEVPAEPLPRLTGEQLAIPAILRAALDGRMADAEILLGPLHPAPLVIGLLAFINDVAVRLVGAEEWDRVLAGYQRAYLAGEAGGDVA
jgi:hypothetical protein